MQVWQICIAVRLVVYFVLFPMMTRTIIVIVFLWVNIPFQENNLQETNTGKHLKYVI